MPSGGSGAKWDETLATDSGLVSDTGLEFRDLRKGVRARLSKEHIDPDAATDDYYGGEHIKGSAVVFYQTTLPTKRPWAATEISATPPDLTADDAGRLLIHSDTSILEYFDGTNWQRVLTSGGSLTDATVTPAKVSVGFVQGIFPLAIIQDHKADGSNGGTFTSGSWQTRTLNQIQTDSGTGIALATNQITVVAGTYRVEASAPGYKCDNHQCRLKNISTGATIAVGTTERAEAGAGYTTRSHVSAEFTVAISTILELQHQCQTTASSNGFGISASFGSGENYAVLKIWKLS